MSRTPEVEALRKRLEKMTHDRDIVVKHRNEYHARLIDALAGWRRLSDKARERDTCSGCDMGLARCVTAIKGGAITCCPDCTHYRRFNPTALAPEEEE